MVEKVYILQNCGEENPFHLFFYMLAQFRNIDNGSDTLKFYYPNEKHCYIREAALQALPPRFQRDTIRRDDCIYMESSVRDIFRIDMLDEQWIFHYIRDLYKHIFESFKQIKGKYSYISRRKAAVRRILNESEYTDALSLIGVTMYCMEDLTFIDQIRLFRESQIITGPHGAAMSFGIFCEPGTILFEIYRADNIKGHYPTLANECSLRYIRYDGVEEFNEVTHDFTIDSQEYIEMLKGLIDFSSFVSS
jgi:hypothetical protein